MSSASVGEKGTAVLTHRCVVSAARPRACNVAMQACKIKAGPSSFFEEYGWDSVWLSLFFLF